ncbi:MAG: TauD/TfdA family dioxygenase [Oceanicoccus sp.]
MNITVTASGEACGATITDVDLTDNLTTDTISAIRAAWLEHHVLAFPDQHMSDEDLERFTLCFGEFGDDPYFESIEGHANIAAIERGANETAPLFASGWHTDWSFMEVPPIATCLYGITIPPTGGDTLFANQHKAYDEMPASLRKRVEGLTAIHSAEFAYAPSGVLDTEMEADRTMKIVLSEDARAKQEHPFIRKHSETGRPGLFSTMGYIQGFVELDKADSDVLLKELYQYQGSEPFVFRQKWQPNMLVMWDNRSVLHMATGGYDGFDRLLHRTTIA